MKILHTSDLHLGKSLLEESLYEDQKYILNQIIDIVKKNNIEVVLIAGDVYDKSIPSLEAVNLFNDFLENLYNLNVEVLITSGNHDSQDRLGFLSSILAKQNIHIVTNYNGSISKYEKDDTIFYMLPYIKPFHLKNVIPNEDYEKILNSNDLFKYILSKEKIDKNKKNILLAHEFVIYDSKLPDTCASETVDIAKVGTIDAIDVNLFKDFSYVALGHIHRPQKIKKETIRYSGTPLKYSFSEVNDHKSVVLIDTNDISNVMLIPLNPLRNLEVLEGTFEDILSMPKSNNLIKVILHDENTILSPMDKIKKRFPNAISLSFENRINIENDLEVINENITPEEHFRAFFELQTNRKLTKEEENYINEILKTI